MSNEEVFTKVMKSHTCSEEEKRKAQEYLKEASTLEQKEYAIYMECIGKWLFTFLKNGEDLKYKLFKKKKCLNEEEAIYAIESYIKTSNDVEGYLLLKRIKKEDPNAFLANLYKACEEVNWDKQKLIELSVSYELEYSFFLSLIKYYVEEILKEDYTIIEKRIKGKESFQDFLNLSLRSYRHYQLSIWYYETYSTPSDKIAFNNTCLKIGALASKLLKVSDRKSVMHFLSKSYNIPYSLITSSLDLYSQTVEKEEKQVKASKEYSHDDISRDLNKSQIPTETTIDKLTSEKESYYNLCVLLLNGEESVIIDEMIKQNNLFINGLTPSFLEEFSRYYAHQDTTLNVEEIFFRVNASYINYLKNINSNMYSKEERKEAKRVITNLLYGKNGRKTFIKEYGPEQFDRYISIIQNCDPHLFELYCFSISKRKPDILDIVKRLVKYLKNGIPKKDNTRGFTILDYYQLIGIPLKNVMGYTIYFSGSDREILTNFCRKNMFGLLSKHEILSCKTEVNGTLDERGFMIPGSGILITEEEANIIIDYLIEQDIPLTSKTYKAGINLYLNGELKRIEYYSRK